MKWRRAAPSSKAQLLQVSEGALTDAILSLPHSARDHARALRGRRHTGSPFRRQYPRRVAQAVRMGVHLGAVLQPLSFTASRAPARAPVAWRTADRVALAAAGCSSRSRSSRATGSSRVEEQDYQNKHQDYRALAEALRIQFFWHVAGVSEKVVDHYLRKAARRAGMDPERAPGLGRGVTGVRNSRGTGRRPVPRG